MASGNKVTAPTQATFTLCRFAETLALDAIGSEARDAAKRAILDSVGCMLGGSRTALAAQTRRVVDLLGGHPQAAISGTGRRSSVALAALANGVHANALDYDDAFEQDGKGMGHPGASIVPAALAMAEWTEASGAELLTAVVAGYEVCDRVIQAIQPTPRRHAQVWGVAVHQAFGAVTAAARLHRLEGDRFLDAFGLAGALSTMPAARKWNWRDRPLASLKDVVAVPAETGVRAALFAAEGYHGSRDILDGDSGFWVMAGSDRCDPARFTERLGVRWTVSELAFKPYPACRWLHAALEGVETIMAAERLDADAIERIEVGTFRDVVENFMDYRPATMVDGEFSLPYAMAALVSGLPRGPAWYSAAALRDPALLRIADSVTAEVDAEAEARHFSDERKSMSAVAVSCRDGRRFERRVPVARGGRERPWAYGDFTRKFHEQADPVIGADAAAELRRRIEGLEDEPAVAAIAALLCGRTGGDPR